MAFRRLVRYVDAQLQIKPNPAYKPYVSLILPCKGLDPGFEDNIRGLLRQDYKDANGQPLFEVIFAVAEKEDPAYRVLNQIISDSRNEDSATAQLVVAGYNQERAQKVNNQLSALQHISQLCEVLVFADSDFIARENLLHNLVAPLEDESIGVTTGYRFYLHRPGNLACLLRAVWNRMSAWEMADPKFAFAWGGAMAVRRKLFCNAKVAEAWEQSADDDLTLTTAIRKQAKKVHFVPQCLVTTKSDEGWPEVVEWMNRQLILTKVYFRPLWMKAVLKAGFMAVWLLMLLSVIAICCVSSSWYCICLLILILAIIPVEIYFLIAGRALWAKLLKEKSAEVPSLLSSILAIPLGHLILPWLTLYSMTTNRLAWRGVVYELRAPDKVRVIL
jgi:cellulose synthase/poly-beta-1,6-N-acetylglucosamine synthase-like glycosyltransferase